MMPVTHLIAAVGTVGWLLGPHRVGLVLAVAGQPCRIETNCSR